MNELTIRLKEEVVKLLTKNKDLLDKEFVVRGSDKYTRRQIAEEIENETDYGIELLANMITLTIDLSSRGKI